MTAATTNSQSLLRIRRCFPSLQTQQGWVYSWHNTNRFIISFTKYCYIEILISEHSSDKMNTFIHYCCLCKLPNHSLQKQYYNREKKIHKDIHMPWSTNLTSRDLSKERIWFCRIIIIKKLKLLLVVVVLEELCWDVNFCTLKGRNDINRNTWKCLNDCEYGDF